MADAAAPSSVLTKRRATSKTAVLLTLCLAALIINIDVTIVNVALPSLVRQLGATTTSLQWVVDAYTLVFAALILAAGLKRSSRMSLCCVALASG